jgi:hypothetical protein
MDTRLAKFKEEQEKHDDLLNIYGDSAIHGSPTLDETTILDLTLTKTKIIATDIR